MANRNLDACLVCGHTILREALNLGNQPLANSYLSEPRELTEYELKVMHCEKCTHTQLSIAVDPDEMYRDYKYVSGTTTTLKDHFASLAETVNDLCDPYREMRKRSDLSMPAYEPSRIHVLDIGCNDGSLLEQFQKRGNTISGVDPAINLREVTQSKGIPVLVDYWDEETAFKLDGTFNAITALNCLAHNSNPKSFIKGCRRVLAPNGVLIVEFPYFKSTIELKDLGQFYAEHHSYFTTRSFTYLIESQGMRVVGSQFFPHIHGGTVRLIVQANSGPHANSVRKMVREESEITSKLYDLKAELHLTIENLVQEIWAEKFLHERKIVVYGASAKSSTLFNLPRMREFTSNLSYVVDDNELKQGLFCPGTNLPIYSPEKLKEEDPAQLVILLTVHNFKDEVVKRLKGLGLHKAILLNYTPEVQRENLEELP